MDTSDIYFKKILVAVDDSEDSIKAFKYAIHRAIKDDVGLMLVSILEENEINVFQAMSKDFIHGKREDLEKHLQEYRQQALDAGVKRVEAWVGAGNPGEEIVNHIIPQVQPDLLVVGSKSKVGITKRFGSQAAYMAKYAPISVLVVR
ncbi:universal stress protein [Lapidilactobacillus bayanensis]|uniref:universal stress protein n=1 Tax=Lapidilactobacillus bayanensis TaxID=2485998 RepID=UPI000F777F17|nr:universal stress protein [Lapidilactobacillus bayanensis]